MSQSNPDPDADAQALGHVPTAQIHQAHQHALRARQNFVSVSMSEAGQSILGHAHKELNRSVLRYLEAMKYLLRTKHTIKKYWHGEPPEDGDQPFDEGAAYLYSTTYKDKLLEEDLKSYRVKFYENHGLPDMPADAAAEHENVPEYTTEHVAEYYRADKGIREIDRVRFSPIDDDSGEIVGYQVVIERPQYGLKRLGDQYQQRRTVHEKSAGLLGIREVEREQPALLPAEILIRAGTALDEAADALSLLAQVDESESLPMIEGFDTSGEEIQGELKHREYHHPPNLE